MANISDQFDCVKVVISDCHIGAGRVFEGRLNPHEDFHFDEELCDLLDHFSRRQYGTSASGPVNVELILAGDFFDFLSVSYQGEFEDAISETLAMYKLEAIINAHPRVMDALRRFSALPGKTITYLIGNHDVELFFPKVRQRILREWEPPGDHQEQKVHILHDVEILNYTGGVEIRHGCQYEPASFLEFDRPFLETHRGERFLNIPWGSIYVMKIINRLKWERDYIDKIRPLKAYIVIGLVTDFWFTVRFLFLSAFYFVKTRLPFGYSDGINWKTIKESVRRLAQYVREEARFFRDLDPEARQILDEDPAIQTIIMGHTHIPMSKIYLDGRQYINTGTWTKMIQLDWRGLGQQFRRTFALIHISGDKAQCELRQWVGEHSPHKLFQG